MCLTGGGGRRGECVCLTGGGGRRCVFDRNANVYG